MSFMRQLLTVVAYIVVGSILFGGFYAMLLALQ